MLVSISYIEIWSGVIRFMYEDENPFRPVRTTVSLIPVLTLFYFLFNWGMSQFIEYRFPVTILFYGFSYLLFNLYNSVCRGLNRNLEYVLSGIISTFTSCFFSLVAILCFHKGIKALILSQSVGYIFAILFVEIRTHALRNSFLIKAERQEKKKILEYCFPLMINSFSFLFLGTYNKNLILTYLGETSSGYYAFVCKFTAIISILISIYSLAWQEIAFQYVKKKNKSSAYSYYINSFFKFVGLGIPLYILIVYIVSPLMAGDMYLPAIKYMPLAIIGAFFAEVSGVFSVIIAVYKKTVHTLLSTITGAIINMVLVNLLIRDWGIDGASFSLAMGFFVAAILRYIFSNRYVKIKLQPIWLVLFFIEIVGVLAMYRNNPELLFFNAISMTLIWLFSNREYLLLCIRKCLKVINLKE